MMKIIVVGDGRVIYHLLFTFVFLDWQDLPHHSFREKCIPGRVQEDLGCGFSLA